MKRRQQHGAIVPVPIEYWAEAKVDFRKFALERMSITRGTKNPFMLNLDPIWESIQRGTKAELTNVLDPLTYRVLRDAPTDDHRPRYMHVDLAKNRDAIGLAMCHAIAFRLETVTVPGESEPRIAPVPEVCFDLAVRLRPRQVESWDEKEFSFTSIRSLIAELGLSRGFNLQDGLITFDGFQSHQMMEELRHLGFVCGLLSVDHTTRALHVDWDKDNHLDARPVSQQPAVAHVALREGFYQGRVTLPGDLQPFDEFETWLEHEAREQEWNAKTRKVQKVAGGSDDLWQAVVGANYNCVNNAIDTVDPGSVGTVAQQRQEERFYHDITEHRTGEDLPAFEELGSTREYRRDGFYDAVRRDRWGL